MSKEDEEEAWHRADLSARLAELQKPSTGPEPTSFGMAARVASELVAALAVGFGIGRALDSWLHTMPLFTLIFIVLGMAAGIWNVYLVARRAVVDSEPPAARGKGEMRKSGQDGKKNEVPRD